jgi:hypothetical protein
MGDFAFSDNLKIYIFNYLSKKKRIADSVKPGMCVGGIGCILVPCHPSRAHEWSNYVETWNVRD